MSLAKDSGTYVYGCSVDFYFFGRDVCRIPHGERSNRQVFGHTSVRIGSLVYECPVGGQTTWYDAEEYLSLVNPLVSIEFLYDGNHTRMARNLVSGLPYDLRGMMREVKHEQRPNAVTCVHGARVLLRTMGLECDDRTPDQLYRTVLRLYKTLETPGSTIAGLRARGIGLSEQGISPDSTFSREG
jgi:hypothetical protein